MVGHQTLNLAIGVRVPASQPNKSNKLRATHFLSRPFCVRARNSDSGSVWIIVPTF